MEKIDGNSSKDSYLLKKKIVSSLTPYFNNKDMLQQYALSDQIFSIYEYTNKYAEDSAFSLGLKQILNCYQEAGALSLNEVLALIVESHEEFINRENIMCSLKQKGIGTEDELYDKIMSYFDYIGTNLEVSVKGVVNELYALICIIKGKSYNYSKICKMDFGVVINNILMMNYFESILKIHLLKLSDWRNIAKHHSYKIDGNEITCIYGKDRKIFKITYDVLLDCTYKITRNSNILNIARCIFVFDNINTISHLVKNTTSSISFRDNIIINQIRITLVLQEFKLEKFERENRILNLEIIDLKLSTKGNDFTEMREACFCKILQEKWEMLDVDRINIKYFNIKGEIVDSLWLEPVI